jgi:cyclophilin family peptidyl-prolyl cis-trans isomerase
MILLLFLACLLQSAAGPEPAIHPSRVVLKTSKGEITLALYHEVAPRHVRHFLHLVRSGYYEGTRFTSVIPGFLVQHGGFFERLRPFTPDQDQLGRIRIAREFGTLRHEKGTLSMSRMPDDPDSATTVFALMLGPAPHMDGKYTIFGKVEKGLDVLDALAAVELRGEAPRYPLNLHRAYIQGEEPGEKPDWSPPLELLFVSGGSIVAGLLLWLAAGRKLPWNAGPMGLCMVLVGAFLGLVSATPRVVASGENRSILALVIFVSMITLFKLMNRFESPRP